ncbi:MAG: filamentous hemagglutinin N-terminal domain-containing protein [Kamptonema sp. SIO1D9]|nr:filamentous hemagglutinin N-terminal domain-containing protein [Kamptonema sp. SIO1D9]
MKKAELNKCYRFGIVNMTAIVGTIQAICVGTAIALWTNSASAQLVPDNSLGEESSRVQRNANINNRLTDLIEGGAIRYETLFHSFSEFNVNQGQRVYFANPAQIENILTRVTGSNHSEILGTLGVVGKANLFLINPNGIIFGPNASLDIRGSFVASTANSFVWDNNLEYSATNPQAPPLLRVNLTPGLQYGTRQPGTIINSGRLEVGKNLALLGGNVFSSGFLAAPQGNLTIASVPSYARVNLTPELGLESISLLSLQPDVAGGDVSVKNAIAQTATLRAENNLILTEAQLATAGNLSLLAGENVQIRDTVNHPFIASAGENLIIQGNTGIEIFALNHPESGLFSGGEMILRSANPVRGDAHYWSGGGFRIEKIDGSLGNLSSPFDPVIRSLGDVSFDSYIGASLHILAAGKVEIPGFIQITGADPLQGIVETVTLSDGNIIAINGQIEPTLDIRAGMNPAAIGVPEISNLGGTFFNSFLIPSSPNLTNTPTSADINLGTIAFTDNDFNTLAGRVLLTNQDRANPTLTGDIQVNATIGNLVPELGDFALVTGGNVTIDSRGGVTLNGVVTTSGISGDAGNFTILANENISAIDTITASVSGNGGQISFLSRNGSINTTNGTLVSAANSGNGGKIELTASGDIFTGNLFSFNGDFASLPTNLDNIFLFDNLPTNGAIGNGGEIAITSSNGAINTTAGEVVSASSSGNGGKIFLDANNSLTAANIITAGEINGGVINLISNNGVIDTVNGNLFSAANNGDAGKISLTAVENITTANIVSSSGNLVELTSEFESSFLPDFFSSPSISGNGGEIIISSSNGAINTTIGNVVSASVDGNGGNISFSSNENIATSDVISSSIAANGGAIQIVSQNGELDLTAGSLISATNGGDGGKIELRARGNISTGNIFSTSGNLAELGANFELDFLSDGLNFNKDLEIGNGGEIEIISDNGAIDTTGVNLISLAANRNGGKITLDAMGDINLGNLISGSGNLEEIITILNTGNIALLGLTNSSKNGNGGEIEIISRNGDIATNAGLLFSGSTNGDGGNIFLTAPGNITTANIFSISNNGNGGRVEITSENGVIETRANIVSTSTIANGGEILLTTAGDIFAGNLISGGNEGNGGQIELISKNGEVNLTNLFIASSLVGEAGQVSVISEGNLNADTAIINTFGKTAGGAIELRSNNGTINVNSSIINSGGSSIDISQFPILAEIDLPTLQLSSQLQDGGAIKIFGSEGINLDTVLINASGGTGSETGRSGATTFESNETIFFNNTILDNETFIGAGNEINLNAEKVILSRSAIVSDSRTDIGSNGRSSDINIHAVEVKLSEGSGIIVQNRSNNPGGSLTINTETLSIFENSIVSTTTDTLFPGGRGGDLTINATDFILLDGSSADFELGINLLLINLPLEERELLTAAIASSTLGEADGGTIVINTPELTIKNGAGILAASANRGDGGSIIINANQIQLSGTSANQVIPSGISVDTVFPDFSGATAGNIIIQTNQLTLTNGAVISASTTSDSPGGDIEIQADLIQLQGTSADGKIRSGIRAQSFAEGNAGSIIVKAENVFVVDEGIIAVSSDTESEEVVNLLARSQQILGFLELFVSGVFSALDIEISAGSGDAGIVSIDAENIFLDERGAIIAITSSGEGGNISLDVDDLVQLRRNSLVSATAGGTGNGGNIDINAEFVIAVPAENSDLTANAFAGNGGNININATEIFGLEFRPGISDRSDITVSSELGIDGTVNLNTPEIDPSRGLTEFSEELPNPEIAQNCQTIGGQTSTSSFIPVGRGGQPASPDRPLNNNSVDVPWTNPNFESSSSSSNQIVEAKGWVRLANGDVVFTNNTPNLSLSGCMIQGSQR